jgi:hypothetical protein
MANDGLEGLVLDSGSNYLVGSTIPVANVAALRALTSAFVGKYVDLASYYAAAGAAPDGGGGLLCYVPGDTTTADNSMTVFVDAANRRWYRVLNGANLTALQAGCHNGATDSTTQLQAAVNLGIPIAIPAGVTITCTSGNITMANNSALLGPGPGAFASANLNMMGNYIQLSGFYVTIDSLTIQGTNANVLIYATGVNLQFNRVTNCFLYNFSGPVVQLACQLNRFLFYNNVVQGSSYGFAFNLGSGNSGNDLSIIGNFISTGSDAIEINSPSTGGSAGLRDIVIADNNLTSGNFGIGLANGHNFTITGNYILCYAAAGASTPQCIHIEDNQAGGVVSGNTMVCANNSPSGYPIYGMFIENNFGTGKTVNVIGNTFVSQNNATATSCSVAAGVLTVGGTVTGAFVAGMTISGPGFPTNTFILSPGTGTGGAGTYNLFNFSGSITGPIAIFGGAVGITVVNNGQWVPDCNISENTFDTFAVGAQLDGVTTYGFTDNLISNCYYGIASNYQIRVVGTTRFHNVQVGAIVGSGSVVGKLIWDDNSATTLISKFGSNVPGVVLDGFALAGIPLTISGAGAQTLAAFPLPSQIYGTIRATVGSGGTANGYKRTETIKWDGTTLTMTPLIDADVGALAGAATTQSAGKVNINFTSTGALAGYSMNIDYSGEYYQA